MGKWSKCRIRLTNIVSMAEVDSVVMSFHVMTEFQLPGYKEALLMKGGLPTNMKMYMTLACVEVFNIFSLVVVVVFLVLVGVLVPA